MNDELRIMYKGLSLKPDIFKKTNKVSEDLSKSDLLINLDKLFDRDIIDIDYEEVKEETKLLK